MSPRTPKYRRAHPEDRRLDLVDATIRCLARDGHAGVSVRRIAAEAGVSAGLVNHHFEGIESLVAAAYEKVANDVLAGVLARVETETAPRARLSAFVSAIFSPTVLDPALLGVWVVFWSLLPHAAPLQTIQKVTFADYRRCLETDLAASAPEAARFDVAEAALGLAALMDGLWLAWCLDPASFRPERGVAICEAHIDDVLARAARG